MLSTSCSLVKSFFSHLVWIIIMIKGSIHVIGHGSEKNELYKLSFSVRAMRSFKPSFDCVSITQKLLIDPSVGSIEN